MPWVVAQIYVTRTRWSSSAFLARPDTWLLVVLVAAAWAAGGFRRVGPALARDPNLKLLLGLALLFVAWTSVCAVAQGAFAPYWVPYLVLGWVLPGILALAMIALGETALRPAWRGLGWGISILLVVSIFLYFASFGLSMAVESVLFNRYVRAPAGVAGGAYFARLTLGDYNSVGIFFAAVAAFCLGRGLSRSRGRAWLSWAILLPSLMVVYLVYSRGAILSVVAAALAALTLVVLYPGLRTGDRILRSVVVLLLFGFVVSRKETLPHWGLASSRAGSGSVRLGMWEALVAGRTDSSLLRTDASKEDQAKQDVSLVEALEHRPIQFGVSLKLPFAAARSAPPPRPTPTSEEAVEAAARYRKELAARVGSPLRRYVLGMGIGNFGLLNGMSFDTGTHSLFLDAFAASGLPGAGIFGAFWCALAWRFWRNLRAPRRADGDSIGRPEPLALLLAFLAVSVSGVIVNFRLDGLGILLPAGTLWLMVLSVPPGAQAEKGDRTESKAA